LEILGILIPAALGLGLIGLIAFLWALRSGQFDDMDGAALRILIDDEAANESDADESERAKTETEGRARPGAG
jgi:cbb3-type cytochrome oxidase maturation protein